MSLFPMFLKLDGRSCLVVGAGTIAEPKIRSLLTAGARVRVVAPVISEAVRAWSRTGEIDCKLRSFLTRDLKGMVLVVAATNSAEVNEAVFHEAQRRGVLCNAVDDPSRCDFYYPAVVRRGDLQIAISTGGLSPALAQRLRRDLELQFGAEYETWLEHLGRLRHRLRKSSIPRARQIELLHAATRREAFALNVSKRLRRGL